MIAPHGYIPFKICEEAWVQNYFDANFQEQIDKYLLELTGPNEDDLRNSVGAQIYTEATDELFKLLKREKIYLFYEKTLLLVSNEILAMHNASHLEEDLGLDGNGAIYYHPQDHIDFLCLPRWDSHILLYLEPTNWTVDTRGFDFISRNLSRTYNPFESRMQEYYFCLLYTSPSPRDLSTSRMPSSA